jgi:hypothetical protein
MRSLLTNFTAVDTSNTPSNEAEAEYKPDVIIFKNDQEHPTHTLFQSMEMFVEFKHGDSSDPFNPGDGLPPKLTNTAIATRGQIILYSIRQRAYQFRISSLSVGIFGGIARLFRWDNTGCVVSAPIKYSTEGGNCQLVEFFIRFNQTTAEARGWDPTVDYASTDEAQAFDSVIKAACTSKGPAPEPGGTATHKEKEGMDPIFSRLADSVGHPNVYLRRKVSVRDGESTRDYIIGRATSVLKASTGRSTRGFVAMSAETKQLVFLKDSWRPGIDGILPEGSWYKIFQEKYGDDRMKNIGLGAYSHGSDVYAARVSTGVQDQEQKTITHIYAKELGLGGAEMMVGYIHHRVVLPTLYLPLGMFRNSKHLTSIMYDIANGVPPLIHLTPPHH